MRTTTFARSGYCSINLEKFKNCMAFYCFRGLEKGKIGMIWVKEKTKHHKLPPKVFYEKAVLKNVAIFTEKHQCRSLFKNNSYEGSCFWKKKKTFDSFLLKCLISKYSFTPLGYLCDRKLFGYMKLFSYLANLLQFLVPTAAITFIALRTKFDHLRFITQNSSPVHCHQLRTFSAELIAFLKCFFLKLRTLFCFYKQPVYDQSAFGTQFKGWIIFSKQQYVFSDIPKMFSVCSASINRIKSLNAYADN